jgi:hypothetical protein
MVMEQEHLVKQQELLLLMILEKLLRSSLGLGAMKSHQILVYMVILNTIKH